MRSRQTAPTCSGLALAGLLVAATFAPAPGRDAKPPDKQAPLPAVEKDVPYADGGDQRMLDLYLPDRQGFTTVVFTYGGGWHSLIKNREPGDYSPNSRSDRGGH
jgi:hypothetical protein